MTDRPETGIYSTTVARKPCRPIHQCDELRAAGACYNGSDAPLRCPASCRICRFPELAKEAYGCGSNDEGQVDLSLAVNETKALGASLREVWQRLNGEDVAREEELMSSI